MATPAQYDAPEGGHANAMAAFRQMAANELVCEVPAGTVYRLDCDGAGGIPYRSGQTWRINGKLLFGAGWVSGYLFHSQGWINGLRGLDTRNVVFEFNGDGGIHYLPGADGGRPRKGLGITHTELFTIRRPRVTGWSGIRNLFSMELRSSRHGSISGGYLGVQNGGQGSDGIHLTGNTQVVDIMGLELFSGDDATGLTHEQPEFAGNTIKQIRFLSCKMTTLWHSLSKLLVDAQGGVGVIDNIQYLGCEFVEIPGKEGAGSSHVWENLIAGAQIKNIRLEGGSTRSLVQPGGLIHDSPFRMKNLQGVVIRDHEVEHFSRQLINAQNVTGLVVDNLRNRVTGTVPAPGSPMPLIGLSNCPGASIDTAGLVPAYTGQTIL